MPSKYSVKMIDYNYEEKKHLLHWPESTRLKNAKLENKPLMHYTMPGVKEDFIHNPIDYRFQETFNKFFPHFDLDLNQRGIVWFTKKGLFNEALNGTSDMLNWMGQGKGKAGRPSEITQVSMETWAIRFQLLLNMRMHAQLLAELSAFEELDAPDLYYQYRSTDKTGSLIPFSLRMIHAEALRFSPFPWKSLIKIQALIDNVEKIIETFKVHGEPINHINDWEKRLATVQLLFIRVLYELGEYKESMALLEKYREQIEDREEKIVIARALMRMAMQSGDEKAMNIFADKANQMSSNTNEMVLHKSYRTIFLGAFAHAQDYIFRLQNVDFSSPQLINTKAIIQLYLGRAKDSVDTIRQIKPLLLGPTTTNLKTMAELCYVTAAKDELLLR